MTNLKYPLVFTLLSLAACAAVTHEPARPDAPSSSRSVEGVLSVEEREIALSGVPASRYGEVTDHRLLPGEGRLVELLASAGIVHDAALSRAAREIARTTPNPRHVPGDLVDAVMAWAGQIDPRPRLTLLELGDPGRRCSEVEGPRATAACAEVLHGIAEGVIRWLPEGQARFGVGMVPLEGEQTRVIVAVSEVSVLLDSLPTSMAQGSSITLRGRLQGGRREPEVVTVDAEGRWRRLEVAQGRGGTFSATVSCTAEAGPMLQVEVLALGAHGPEVVANFRIACGGPPPTHALVMLEDLAPEATLDDVVRANFTALNDERRRAGLEPFRWSDDAAGVARAHSEDMVRSDFVGHQSPATGSVRDRFKRARVPAAALRENIARGYGPLGIHRGLMNSPGHRMNLLADDVTHVGVGAAWDNEPGAEPGTRRPIILTQNFFSELGSDAPDDPTTALRRRIATIRSEAGLPPIRWDATLDGAARGLADGVARGREDAARRDYDALLRASDFRSVDTRLIVVGSFSRLVELPMWRGAVGGVVGMSIARFESGETAGALAMVISLGRR